MGEARSIKAQCELFGTGWRVEEHRLGDVGLVSHHQGLGNEITDPLAPLGEQCRDERHRSAGNQNEELDESDETAHCGVSDPNGSPVGSDHPDGQGSFAQRLAIHDRLGRRVGKDHKEETDRSHDERTGPTKERRSDTEKNQKNGLDRQIDDLGKNPRSNAGGAELQQHRLGRYYRRDRVGALQGGVGNSRSAHSTTVTDAPVRSR